MKAFRLPGHQSRSGSFPWTFCSENQHLAQGPDRFVHKKSRASVAQKAWFAVHEAAAISPTDKSHRIVWWDECGFWCFAACSFSCSESCSLLVLVGMTQSIDIDTDTDIDIDIDIDIERHRYIDIAKAVDRDR